jgi:hypothetical protein
MLGFKAVETAQHTSAANEVIYMIKKEHMVTEEGTRGHTLAQQCYSLTASFQPSQVSLCHRSKFTTHPLCLLPRSFCIDLPTMFSAEQFP